MENRGGGVSLSTKHFQSPEITNWFETTLFKPSMCMETCVPTSDRVSASALSSAATVKTSGYKRCKSSDPGFQRHFQRFFCFTTSLQLLQLFPVEILTSWVFLPAETSCKHALTYHHLLSWYSKPVSKQLFIYTFIKQWKSYTIIHLELCLDSPGEFKSNIYLLSAQCLVSTDSQSKYLAAKYFWMKTAADGESEPKQ